MIYLSDMNKSEGEGKGRNYQLVEKVDTGLGKKN